MNKALIHWNEIIEDIQRMTDEYEESGWKTLVLHPGDVSIVTSEAGDQKAGFRLVIPESELDALTEMIDEDEDGYDEFEVHRAPEDELLLFVVIVKSPGRKEAVFCPIYYDPKIDREFIEELREQDAVFMNITNLSRTHRFVFSHDKPTLFIP